MGNTSFPTNMLERIVAANIIITSDLKRSIESAKLFNSDLTAVSDPLFRETELPIPTLRKIKLNPDTWSWILRFCCFWVIQKVANPRLKQRIELKRHQRY